MKESKATFKDEQRYADWLSKLPYEVRRFVVICGVKFKPPRWRGDQNKLAGTVRGLKLAVLFFYVVALIFAAMTLATNNKNKEWDIFTFNEHGDVKWVSELRKVR